MLYLLNLTLLIWLFSFGGKGLLIYRYLIIIILSYYSSFTRLRSILLYNYNCHHSNTTILVFTVTGELYCKTGAVH